MRHSRHSEQEQLDEQHRLIRDGLIREVYRLMGHYMYLRAYADEHNDNASIERSRGVWAAAAHMEGFLTGKVDSCNFITVRTEKMLLRSDKQNAIKELYTLANQAIKG